MQPLLPAPIAAAAAGAGGINDDNREGWVKGEVGDPSKTQVTVCSVANSGTLLDRRHLFSVSVSDICEASIHSV